MVQVSISGGTGFNQDLVVVQKFQRITGYVMMMIVHAYQVATVRRLGLSKDRMKDLIHRILLVLSIDKWECQP